MKKRINVIKNKISSLVYKGKKIEVWEIWRIKHTKPRFLSKESLEINNLPSDYLECECGYNSIRGNQNIKIVDGKTYCCQVLKLEYCD